MTRMPTAKIRIASWITTATPLRTGRGRRSTTKVTAMWPRSAHTRVAPISEVHTNTYPASSSVHAAGFFVTSRVTTCQTTASTMMANRIAVATARDLVTPALTTNPAAWTEELARYV